VTKPAPRASSSPGRTARGCAARFRCARAAPPRSPWTACRLPRGRRARTQLPAPINTQPPPHHLAARCGEDGAGGAGFVTVKAQQEHAFV